MAVISIDQFRQPLINKRDEYIEFGINGVPPEKLYPTNGSNTVTPRYYAILNECIWDNDRANFIDIKYGTDIDNLTRLDPTHYEVNPTTAVITFEENYVVNVPHYAFYKGGGSIVWVQDVTSLQKACVDIDNNTVYKDGSVTMTGDLNFGTHNILNVNSIEATTVDGLHLRNHSHTGGNYDAPQITVEGLAESAVQTSKINNYAVTEIKIGTDAVTTSKIMDYSVTLDKMNSNSVNNDKIVNNTIQNSKLLDGTIENNKIKNRTIEYTKLNIDTTNQNNVLKGIFNVLYPVGSIYITSADVDTCPIQAYVGTWEKVSVGRVLQGANSNQQPNTTVEAGLPDHIHAVRYNRGGGGGSGGGDLNAERPNTDVYWRNTKTVVDTVGASNTIYGKSNTVQPPAYLVNIFRRKA